MVISRPLSAPFPLPQYINVKLVYKNGTWEKLPCNASGHVIDAHDPANWMTWEQACAAPETLGVGFVFTPGCGYFFLDLDNAWTGSAWSAAAVTITERFAGCALEVSHSGKGLHIFGRWTPMLHKSKGWLAGQRVELYTEGRFCLLTGAHWLGNAETDASAAVAALIAEAGLMLGADPVSPVTAQSGGDDAPLERFRLSALGEADDDTLIRAMLAATGGGAVAFGEKISIAQLWNADEAALRKHFPETSARGFDWSSADASLMFHLAFWTGSHVSRMVRLFRRSPLYRAEKYEGRGAYRLALITGPAVSTLNGRCYDRPRANMSLPPTPSSDVMIRTFPITPFRPQPEELISPRPFMLGTHYIRGETSGTWAPGGKGKTAIAMVEAASLCSGKRLLYDMSNRFYRVIYFGEDSINELERRWIAIVKHFGLNLDYDIADRLVMISLRDHPLTLLKGNQFGYEINQADVNAVKQLITDHKGDVVFFDTIKQIHTVNENDNGQMHAVIMTCNRIATECQCAIELLGHTKKPGLGGVSIDDARGGRAQLDALRSARLLTGMTQDEARTIGIEPENYWSYLRFVDSKVNMTPPIAKSRWYRLISMTLNNKRDISRDHNGPDNVQVAITIKLPEASDDLTDEKINAIKEAVNNVVFQRRDRRAKDWIGYVIADVMNINVGEFGDSDGFKDARKNVDKIVDHLIKNDVFEIYTEKGDKINRREFEYVRVKSV